MWARIDGDRVAEITDIDPAGRFHPSLQWVRFDGRKGVQPGWIYDGQEFSEPEPEPEPIPASVTARQARLVMLNHGLLDQVEDAIAAIPDEADRRRAEIEWEYAGHIERDAAWLIALSGELGLSAEQVDDMFIEGARL